MKEDKYHYIVMKPTKIVPQFNNEDEEDKFWESHSILDYPEQFKRINLSFPNLKPTSKTVSLSLPEWMLDRLKILANKKAIPYKSFIKTVLGDKIKEESLLGKNIQQVINP